MKNIVILFILVPTFFFAQQSKGYVFDNDLKPIKNVNIFLDGTTFATQSDANGSFSINYKAFSSKTLIVSCVGFQTKYISDYNNNFDLQIVLKPEIIELNEVSINFDQFSRAQKLRFFKNEFLGKTANGRNCMIQNENDIFFFYDKNARSLQVFSNKPLVVINKNLGYKIHATLIGFEAKFYRTNINPSEMYRCYFEVNSHFEEIANSESIQKRRSKAFDGSHLNFFRNMSKNEWSKNKFMLLIGNYALNPPDFFELSNDGYVTTVDIKQDFKSFRRKSKPVFDVVYKNRKKSQVTFETQSFTIDIFGNNNQVENIIFSGDLSERRVGSMVPMDFGIK